jgi:hypothetical protein
MSDPFEQKNATRLMIFGHPSHELALFGMLQRHRPAVVVITDGGEAERVEQSRRGLDFIGLGERVRYLGYSEASFYDALLARDHEFFPASRTRCKPRLSGSSPNRFFATRSNSIIRCTTLPCRW